MSQIDNARAWLGGAFHCEFRKYIETVLAGDFACALVELFERKDRLIEQQAARIERLEAQVLTLQSDENSWQSGYDRGRSMAKQRGGVVLPERLKRGDEGGSGEYGAAMIRGFNACLREVARLNPPGTFRLGDPVRKIRGSQWSGRIVGTYSTELTPEGYAVESFTEKGSVQIYPAAALEACEEPGECEFHGADSDACNIYSGRVPCSPAECVAVPRELLKTSLAHLEWFGKTAAPEVTALRAVLAQQGKPATVSLPLAYWEPCNPACDVDLGGARSRRCDCEQAKAALAQQGKAVGDE